MCLWWWHLLLRLGLLLKHVGKFREVQKSLLTGTGRNGKFRSHCSREREEPGSLEAISCHFARRYLPSASSNFFGNRDPVMLWYGPLRNRSFSSCGGFPASGRGNWLAFWWGQKKHIIFQWLFIIVITHLHPFKSNWKMSTHSVPFPTLPWGVEQALSQYQCPVMTDIKQTKGYFNKS